MNKKRVITIAIMTCGLVLSNIATASPERCGAPWGQPMARQGPVAMLMKRADELDLTPQQRRQLGDLLEQQRAGMRSSREAMRELHRRMRELVRAERFDEAAVRQVADEQARLIAKMKVQGARTRHAIHRLLTPEQRERLERMRPPRRGGHWRRDNEEG